MSQPYAVAKNRMLRSSNLCLDTNKPNEPTHGMLTLRICNDSCRYFPRCELFGDFLINQFNVLSVIENDRNIHAGRIHSLFNYILKY